MVLLLLETIIVIMNNIRWCGWSCFLVVVRGLHRPFILIHHHKTKILLNRSLPSLFLLSLSLSLVVVVVGERKSDIKATMKFLFWGWLFFPRTLYHHREKRFAPHATLDDDAKQHDNEEETTTNKKKERRRRRGSNSRTRWVFSNSRVSLVFTMLVRWISQCWDWNRSVWTVGF